MINMGVRWVDKLPEDGICVTRVPPKCKIFALRFSCPTEVAMDRPKCACLEALFWNAGDKICVVEVTVALFLTAVNVNTLLDGFDGEPVACIVLDDNATANLLYEGHDKVIRSQLTRMVGSYCYTLMYCHGFPDDIYTCQLTTKNIYDGKAPDF